MWRHLFGIEIKRTIYYVEALFRFDYLNRRSCHIIVSRSDYFSLGSPGGNYIGLGSVGGALGGPGGLGNPVLVSRFGGLGGDRGGLGGVGGGLGSPVLGSWWSFI